MKRRRRKKKLLASVESRPDWSFLPGYCGISCMLPEERLAIEAAIPQTGKFLEIGTLHGVTVATWATARPDARFLSVDPFVFLKAGKAPMQNWHRNKQPNMALLVGTVDDVTELSPRPFDVVLIDGDHSEDGCYHDLVACAPLLWPWGQLIVHDYRKASNPGVEPAARRFCEESDYEIVRTVGTLIWLKPGVRVARGPHDSTGSPDTKE